MGKVLDKKPETVAHYIILNLPPFFFECLHANAQLKRFGGGYSGPKSQLSLLALCRNN